jgi:hypothetical protein
VKSGSIYLKYFNYFEGGILRVGVAVQQNHAGRIRGLHSHTAGAAVLERPDCRARPPPSRGRLPGGARQHAGGSPRPGCSANEIAAISGHKTLREVQRYTDAADQAKLAQAAMARTVTPASEAAKKASGG